MTAKTIIVTGGAGFLGSFLCEALLKQGHRVICIDNFTTGHVRNIEGYLRNPNFQFIRHDLNTALDLEKIPELEPFKISFHGVQEIYHLATPTTISNFDDYMVQTLLSNSLATYHALEWAVKYQAKILLGSSSVVYGPRTEEVTIFKEDYQGIVDHMSPRACYDEGKRYAETMMITYKQVHNIDTKIARIFRTYGPRTPLFDGQQIPDFVLAALENKPLVINGGENFATSLIYVSDVVDGLLRLMATDKDIGPVNIGSDYDLTMGAVAKKIIELTGSNSEIKNGKELRFLSEIGLPNIQKAKEELGWVPLVRLEDGLRRTIDYIKANKLLLTSGENV